MTTKVQRRLLVRSATRSACGPQKQLTYSWEMSPAVEALKTDRSHLFIRKSALKAGVTYTATLTVSYADDASLFSSASASISVVSMPLQAKLKGPVRVGACPGGKVTLKTVLNDPDETSDTVHYTWSSARTTQCPELNALLAQSTADHAIIPGAIVGAGRTCTVQCVLTKGARTTIVTRNVVGIGPPVPDAHFTYQHGITVKVSDTFELKTSVSESDCGALTYQWDFDFPAANPPSTTSHLLVQGGIAVPGKYNVSVTVCNSAVCAAAITTFVVVKATPPPPMGVVKATPPPRMGTHEVPPMSDSTHVRLHP